MICGNCGDAAIYLVADPGASELVFCRACLPPHMQARADAGAFPLPAPPVEDKKKK